MRLSMTLVSENESLLTQSISVHAMDEILLRHIADTAGEDWPICGSDWVCVGGVVSLGSRQFSVCGARTCCLEACFHAMLQGYGLFGAFAAGM